jgi:Protein of unknown function (DUF3616)
MPFNLPLNQVTLEFAAESSQLCHDLSAVVLDPEGYLWLASDETTTLERLSRTGDHRFADHRSFALTDFFQLPDGATAEIDIEGLAVANHYLWVVGSHSYKRRKAKLDRAIGENLQRMAEVQFELNRYFLARIPLIDSALHLSHPAPSDPDLILTAAMLPMSKRGNLLTEVLQDDPHLGSFLISRIPGKENGFDIEGLAVDRNRLFLGLRGPVINGWAIILELEVKLDQTPNTLKLKKIGDQNQRYKKHFLNLEGLGIRDLCIWGTDLLVLAGPTMSLDGAVKVFRVPNLLDAAAETLQSPPTILEIPYGLGCDRAEGITFLTQTAEENSLLVVYDAPDPKQRLQGTNILADTFQL